jgi:glutaredoxin|tara:strand:- start:175 stop:465 length:291 start_codon:yes stop_codon:yes gene_type:complete
VNKYFHIYGAIDCPYCLEAITLLTSLGYEYSLTLIDQSPTYSALIKTAYGHSTIPIVTYCENLDREEFVGGADDLVKYLQKSFDKKDTKDLTAIDE